MMGWFLLGLFIGCGSGSSSRDEDRDRVRFRSMGDLFLIGVVNGRIRSEEKRMAKEKQRMVEVEK
jgi:hypothetical protein